MSILFKKVSIEDDMSFVTGLFQKYYNILLGEAESILHNRYDAEDTVQEFFVYVIKNTIKFRRVDPEVLPYFLVICVRRRCIDVIRKRSRSEKLVPWSIDCDDFVLGCSDRYPSPEEAAINQITYDEMKEALSKLPESTQKILECKYILGMSDREIANLIGIKPNSVREYLTRAKRRVLKHLGESENEKKQ